MIDRRTNPRPDPIHDLEEALEQIRRAIDEGLALARQRMEGDTNA